MRPIRLVVVTLLIGVAAACGGSDGGDDATTATEEPTEAGSSAASSPDDAEWEAIVEAAKEEGRVVVYASVPGTEERLKNGFEEMYPEITVEVFRSNSGEILGRLDQEATTGATGADVTLHADVGWYETNVDRLVDTPLSPAYLEYHEGTDRAFHDGRYVTADVSPLYVAYNTAVLEEAGAEPIEAYTDLLQPELAGGLIGFTEPASANVTHQYWYHVAEASGGEEFVQAFADQDPIPYLSAGPLGQALGAGEHAVAIYMVASVTNPLVESGAPLELVMPDPAAGSGHWSGIVDWSTNPNAAQLFRDWLISPAGQIALNGTGELLTPMSLDEIEGAPDTMSSIPSTMIVVDGVITDEQQSFLDEIWTPVFG